MRLLQAFPLVGILWATHNLAGQITYDYLGPNRYRVAITTYTDSAAAGVDRCTADLEVWSVIGTTRTLVNVYRNIPRSNGPSGSSCAAPARLGVNLRPRVKKNFYIVEITLPGPGSYELRYTDFARVENVRNMSNSGAVSFYIETILNNNPFIGINRSPLLLNDPIDDACTNRLWTHNPGAYDPDGDSLVFSLIPCQQYDPTFMQNPVPVPNYRYPSAFGGTFTIDRQTGLLRWNTPQQVGVYNVAILIEEYRRGRKIGHVIRDMAIFVYPCQNNPPVIEVSAETCVVAGSRLRFTATAYDPDRRDSLYFYLNNGGIGNNGPFQVQPSPATIVPSVFPITAFLPPQAQATVTWQTLCEHVRSQPYQIDWYAHDNLSYRPPLAANAITRIYVIPPAPTRISANVGPRQITLTWSPAACVPDNYLIYRSTSAQPYPDTPCCRAPLSGYTLIAVVRGTDTTFVDRDLEFNPRYCYRIRARLRGVLSCPSPEVCVEFPLNFPVMLQDSIHTTASQNGVILVSWHPPLVLDSIFFPPPYRYTLERAVGMAGTGFSVVASDLSGTRYVDAAPNLATSQNPYRYRVRLKDGSNREIAVSNIATSLFLTLEPRDRAMLLRWEQNVPWTNDTFYIFRADPPQPGTFRLVARIPARVSGRATFSYLDAGLTNDQTYCYYVLSRGSYYTPGVPEGFENASNKACAEPRDTVPPCLPDPTTYRIEFDCEMHTVSFSWLPPDTTCGGDVGSYGIYIAQEPIGPYRLITYVREPERTFTWRGPGTILFCFAFTARDTVGNESRLGPPICLDNCPVIMVPNTFTPNADGINDVFRPFIYRNIRRVRCWIYDRWGLLVSFSENIDLLWDGTKNGQPMPEGTYFYVLEAELDTREPRLYRKAGSITLLR
ncbi:MAG: gliding motility-associated C-terminal domain-containing protein [Bacteroidia bacterium]|nr:gliding motility-associated C-terminal domain-containing protein [Bacteroidia bacterium]MDW8236087.1 gliding motility-associated C-terminal domain-containing protein [Bacteroidia bacterium]